MKKKIVIIGAGPVGCYTAQVLKTYGYDPLLIEEHAEVGKPVHCTGLVGNKVFTEKRHFSISPSSILAIINGAIIHYDNQSFVIKRNNVAYVIDRERFDKELSEGLNILYGNKFLGLEKTKSDYIIETDKDELFADIVIGADGANSITRRILNHDTNNIRYYKGVQLRLKTKPRHKDLVEVYLKKPSFFWLVPETEDIVRIGTISENPYNDLQNFLEETKIKGEILEKFGGLVSIGICNNTAREHIAIVGDAACQLKPLSYGGVYFGLRAADILARCIKENRIQDYDWLWKTKLAAEIRMGLKIKEIYNRLNKEELGKLFRLLKNQKSLIEKIGDFENHSRFILEIMKKPTLYPQIGEIFRIFFKTIF